MRFSFIIIQVQLELKKNVYTRKAVHFQLIVIILSAELLFILYLIK